VEPKNASLTSNDDMAVGEEANGERVAISTDRAKDDEQSGRQPMQDKCTLGGVDVFLKELVERYNSLHRDGLLDCNMSVRRSDSTKQKTHLWNW
jgi:hypothetical protein